MKRRIRHRGHIIQIGSLDTKTIFVGRVTHWVEYFGIPQRVARPFCIYENERKIMSNRKPGRPVLSDEEKKWKSVARALFISVEGAKRIMRTGKGSINSRMVLAREFDLSDRQLILGTTEAARREQEKFQGLPRS